MIQAVIFDLDGLLVDTEIISYKIYKELLAEYGIDYTLEEYTKNYSGKTARKNVAYCIENYQLPWTLEEALEQIFDIEKRLLLEGVDLKTGARELLTFLKENHYKIALATSSIETRARDILRQHELEGFFDVLVFGHEVQNGKPAPDIFLKACEKLQEEPEHALVLEDSAAGIRAAYAAHIPVICIPDMKKPDADTERLTCCMLQELTEVIHYLSDSSCK